MKTLILKNILVLALLTFTACGFQVLDTSKNNNFSVKKINNIGDKRIGFKIKNNIISATKKSSQNNLIINLDTKKIKSIKEKNIKNEITKYKISLIINVEYRLIEEVKMKKLNISVIGDHLTSKNYSDTLSNEKSVIESLIEQAAKKIVSKIAANLNDS